MGDEGGNCSNNMDRTTAPTAYGNEGAFNSTCKHGGCGLIIPPERRDAHHHEVLQMTIDQLCYGDDDGGGPTEEDRQRKSEITIGTIVVANSYRAMTHLKHCVEKYWENTLESNNNQPNVERVISRCRHCYKEFECPQRLQVHTEVVHMLDNTSTVCRICELEFSQTWELLEHMRTHHRFPEMPYRCKICSYKTSIHKNIIRHIRSKHRYSAKFHCYFCLLHFANVTLFRKHSEDHHKKVPWPCLHCRLVFIKKIHMENHINSDHMQLPLSLSKRLKVDKERLDKCWIVATAKENIKELRRKVSSEKEDPDWRLEIDDVADTNDQTGNQARIPTDVASNDNDSDFKISYDSSGVWWVRERDAVLEEECACMECGNPWRREHFSLSGQSCPFCGYKTACIIAYEKHTERCRSQDGS